MKMVLHYRHRLLALGRALFLCFILLVFNPFYGFSQEDFKPVFGTFETKTTYENNQLLCSRKVILKGGAYKASEYTAWIHFLKKPEKRIVRKLFL